MDQILGTVADSTSTDISNQEDFATLLTQLQLMAEVGDPANKDQISKEEFKNIDFNSVVPAGTTGQSFDAAQVMSDLTTQIENATGETIDPTFATALQAAADKTATEGVTYFDNRTSAATAATTAATTPAASTTAVVTNTGPITGLVTDPTSPTPAATTAVTTTAATTAAATTAAATAVQTAAATTAAATMAATTAAATSAAATTVDGSGGTNINGINGNTTPVTGSGGSGVNGLNGGVNGYGAIYGDPHIKITNLDEPAICFDIHGRSSCIVTLFVIVT